MPEPAPAATSERVALDVVEGIRGLEPGLGRLLVAVGVFDGLHRGHAYLLRRLVRAARDRGARPTVLTFDAHPDEVLRGAAPPLLLDPAERLVRLAAAGVEVVVVVHFDATLRATPYDAFVASLAERVDLAGFVMTPDSAFGYERRGTPDALTALGSTGSARFEVVVVPPFLLDGRAVRSSEVRSAVADGSLAEARRLLGRRHAVTGSLDATEQVRFALPVALPPAGVYEVLVGPAWSLDTTSARRGRPGTARIDGRGVAIDGARPAVRGTSRVRVAFDRRTS